MNDNRRMSVYNPSGSDNVHIDTTISGGKASKPKTMPAKVVKAKKAPVKKVVQAKKSGKK